MLDEAGFNALKSAPFAQKPGPTVNAAAAPVVRTVADPSDSYLSLLPLWTKSRAVCRGQDAVKALDSKLDVETFSNLLIPFSPSMTQHQYDFYKSEAELPGITAQFSRTLVGGLLRKTPTLTLPDGVPEGAAEWIINEFAQDDSSLVSFMDEALWEEVQTSRAWLRVDYPDLSTGEVDALDGRAKLREAAEEDEDTLKPYPVLHLAESVINHRTRTSESGRTILDRLIVRGFTEFYDDDRFEFHPGYVETVWVHELGPDGFYQVRVYKGEHPAQQVVVVAGDKVIDATTSERVKLDDTIQVIYHGERIRMIPAWPLNGTIEGSEPILIAIVNKEIALYNKISRRNHLMYGAATYTPIISSTMSDDQFIAAVGGGLGSWIHLPNSEDKADIMKTPTEALADMDRAIAAAYEEIAKLGVRMLAPEADQSGVALDIRNAAQTAQLGSLNTKVSSVLRQVIAFMINWRYNLEISAADVEFELSSDFNPMPQGPDWLRLATEWYQAGLIPRRIWLLILKQNDMMPPDYDDDEGQKEMNEDELVVNASEQLQAKASTFADKMKNATKEE